MVNQLQRVAQARTRLVECMPFFGRLSLYLRPRLSEDNDFVSSMAVGPDGTLVINEDFCESLSDSELTACLIHEVLHVALLFWSRLQNRLARLFNAAQDYAINHIIHEVEGNNITLPSCFLLNPEFSGKSAEEIYDVLFKRRKSDKTKNRHMIDDCRIDILSGGHTTKELEAAWKDRLIDAVSFHEKCKGRGSLPAGLKREIGRLLNSKTDWLDQIRDHIAEFGKRSEFSFRIPSRRTESAGQLLASRLPSSTQVVVLIDTSASITTEYLTRAITEIGALCETLGVGIRVITIDADIQSDIEITDVEGLKLTGNGGSNFIPAFTRLKEEFFTGTVIAFTDGDITVPKQRPDGLRDVLWIVGAKDKAPTSKWGRVVRLT